MHFKFTFCLLQFLPDFPPFWPCFFNRNKSSPNERRPKI
jgi:hypothetical protein